MAKPDPREQAVALLEGGNIVAHMRHIAGLQRMVDTYFHMYSKLWRKIEHHIANDQDQVLVEFPKTWQVRGSRASYGVHRQSCGIYAMDFVDGVPKPPKTFWMDIRVDFTDEEEGNEFSKSFHVNVPVDLELDCTDEKFDAWIASIRKIRDDKVNARELAEYQRLKLKFEGNGKSRRRK